jgi:hypothetical protein
MLIKIAILWVTLTVSPQWQFKWKVDCCAPIQRQPATSQTK